MSVVVVEVVRGESHAFWRGAPGDRSHRATARPRPPRGSMRGPVPSPRKRGSARNRIVAAAPHEGPLPPRRSRGPAHRRDGSLGSTPAWMSATCARVQLHRGRDEQSPAARASATATALASQLHRYSPDGDRRLQSRAWRSKPPPEAALDTPAASPMRSGRRSSSRGWSCRRPAHQPDTGRATAGAGRLIDAKRPMATMRVAVQFAARRSR